MIPFAYSAISLGHLRCPRCTAQCTGPDHILIILNKKDWKYIFLKSMILIE